MKLRIKGNTIRFRLTQTEVDTVAKGEVVDRTRFPGGNELVYTIKKGNSFSADFNNGSVFVQVPSEQIEEWAQTDKVTIGQRLALENGDELDIAIEKDFQCLTERPNEDESDMFPNPLDKHKNC